MKQNEKLLPLIAAFKLLKATGLFIVALGLHRLLGPNQADILTHWVRVVRVDPDNALVHSLVAKLTGLSHRRLEELNVGTFLYGVLFATEGTGLLLKKRWAEYFTTISTAAFLPIEVYELVKRVTILKGVVLLANVAVVVYLVKTLLRPRHQKSVEPSA